jgi:hypothetical protein
VIISTRVLKNRSRAVNLVQIRTDTPEGRVDQEVRSSPVTPVHEARDYALITLN